MANSTPMPAPWRSDFVSHVNKMESPIFNLSSLHPIQPTSALGPLRVKVPQYVPRSRTVVYRGMWASLPMNPKNTAEPNPNVYESDMLTITSDARMEKIPKLFNSVGETSSQQSGAGGPVEAVFWVTKTQTQWRLRGRTYIIGPDIETDSAAAVRGATEEFMRQRQPQQQQQQNNDGNAKNWSWSKELTAHFGNLSPGMRGSFRNPPPGTPLSQKPAEGLKLGQKVEDLHDSIARANFRVLVIVPEEVDRVDLTNPSEAKRWNYTLKGTEWETTELWP